MRQTIKQYSESHNVSYEAVRRQLQRYAAELKGHISTVGGTRFLDDYAIDFLTNKRKPQPLVVMEPADQSEAAELRRQLDELKAQLMAAQNELLVAKDRIIGLQDDARKAIEDRARLSVLLEEKTETQARIEEIERQRADDRKTIEDLKAEVGSFRRSIFGLYRKDPQKGREGDL